MENTAANLKPSFPRMVLLSSVGLLSGVAFGTVLLFPYCLIALIGEWGGADVLLGSGVISAALLPAVYLAVKRTVSGLWGRFHLGIAVSVITSAFFTAWCWNINPDWHIAGKIIVLSLSLPVSVLSLSALGYMSFAVNRRMIGEDKRYVRLRNVFHALGGIIGAAIVFLKVLGFNLGEIGYILSSLILVVGMVFYFASVNALPRFVRPDPEKITLKNVLNDFYPRLGKPFALSFVGCVFAGAGLTSSLSYAERLGEILSAGDFLFVLAATLCLAAAFVSFYAAWKKKASVAASVTGAVIAAVALAGIAVTATFSDAMPAAAAIVVVCACYTTIGVGAGMSLVAALSLMRAFGKTARAGIRYERQTLISILALAIGGAAASGLSALSSPVSAIAFSAVAACFLITGTVLSALSRRAETKKESEPC